MDKLTGILFRGKEHQVKIIAYPGKNTQVLFRNDVFNIYINNKQKEAALYKEASQQLRSWLTEEAAGRIKQSVEKYSRIIGVSYNNIRIKDIKTRWGSCSSKGNVNFNFRLVMVPEEVMEYVVVHELCHLRYMNHSKDFWNEVGKYMPDYEKHKEWLKKNGAQLFTI